MIGGGGRGRAPTRDETQAYYQEFSVAVGRRDWLRPNLRHEQLKLFVDDVVAPRKRLAIADIGCGTGVMTDHLRRYGAVTGVDFSAPAIAVARQLVPGATFAVGGLEALGTSSYDVLTLFDVLEHIPAPERPELLRGLRERLSAGGIAIVSTPFPSATRSRRERSDDTLQIVDEEVELPQLLHEAAAAGLQLLRFEAYDVFAGSPEYQVMVFSPVRRFGGPPVLVPRALDRRARIVRRSSYRRLRRLRLTARALQHGDLTTARWALRGRPPAVRS